MKRSLRIALWSSQLMWGLVLAGCGSTLPDSTGDTLANAPGNKAVVLAVPGMT